MKPVLFSIGPIQIYSFGLMIMLGVVLSLYLMGQKVEKSPLPAKDKIFDLVFVVLGVGFLGGRIAYIIQQREWYFEDPLKIFAVWEGGLIFYGGLIGGFLGLVLYAKKHKYSLWALMDYIVPYVALSQAFGRVGCFLNGCCHGKVCELPWAVSIPGTLEKVHPTQLYETGFLLVLFAFLRKLYDQNKTVGFVAFLYFVLYAAGRFVIEFFRSGNPMLFFFTWNQWLSIAIALTATLFYLKVRKTHD